MKGQRMETKELTKKKVYGMFRNGTLTRTVLFRKHFYWKHRGYSFGIDYLNTVNKRHQIETIRIVEQDTGKVFTIPYQTFLDNSVVVWTDYGKQRVISMDYLKQEQNETDEGNDNSDQV